MNPLKPSRPLSPKRLTIIEKDKDDYINRLHLLTFNTPVANWQLRLNLLTTFSPKKSTRQNFNHARMITWKRPTTTFTQ